MGEGEGEGEAWPDLPGQLESLQAVARSSGVTSLVLRDPATLAWLFGARVHVPQTLDTACFDVVVDGGAPGTTRLTIVTNSIEAPRLQDTELAGLPANWSVVHWWQARESQLPTGAQTGSDRPVPGSVDVAGEVNALRRTLTPRQQETLAEVCRDAASAATRAVGQLSSGHSEYAAAAVLAAELLAAELEPIVLLVAGGDRAGRHRHPLPTAAPLGQRAMLACCARRHGLVASVTRFVSFVPLTDADRDQYRRLLEVEKAFLDASQPGVRLGDVVTAGVTAYAHAGLAPNEWHRHHQGGFSGWQPREFPAHMDHNQVLGEGMVVAWNPSSNEWKVEDTSIVREGGPRALVHDPTWPATTIGDRVRPGVLELT